MMDDHELQMSNIDALLHIQNYYNQRDVEDDHRMKYMHKSTKDLCKLKILDQIEYSTNLFIRHCSIRKLTKSINFPHGYSK
jgi:hypothetical protein